MRPLKYLFVISVINLFNKIHFYIKGIEYIKFPKLKGILLIRNMGKISIGKNVYINSGRHFNPIGGDVRTIFWTGPKGKIIIGNDVGISNSVLVSFISIKIGNNVLIGGGCKIYDTDFHPIKENDRIIGKENTSLVINKPVEISDGVFIGGHTIILKGVNIGEGSVIGAGSVVTKNVPTKEIWAGNPAKFIKKI